MYRTTLVLTLIMAGCTFNVSNPRVDVARGASVNTTLDATVTPEPPLTPRVAMAPTVAPEPSPTLAATPTTTVSTPWPSPITTATPTTPVSTPTPYGMHWDGGNWQCTVGTMPTPNITAGINPSPDCIPLPQ